MSREAAERLRSLVERIWNEKEPDLITELVDPECVIRSPEGDLRGPAGYRSLFDTYVNAFPDCHLVIEEVVANGDWSAFSFSFSGTHTGSFRGFPATGKRVTVPGISMQETVRGRLHRVLFVWDAASLLEQVGILTGEPPGS